MGFFLINQAKAEKKKATREKGPARVSEPKIIIPILQQRGLSCRDCTLDREPLKHPKMAPTGAKRPLLYILGEAPGQMEDEEGEQFIGKAGSYIRDYIPRAIEKHTRWNNTLRCRPPGNRAPTDHEMRCCSHWQREDIALTKPLIVMGFGNAPLEWALGRSAISRWHGLIVPVSIGGHKCWYAPVWHPSYIARSEKRNEKGEDIFQHYLRDLERVFALIQQVLDGDGIDVPWIPQGEELDAGIHMELSWDLGKIEDFLEHLCEWPDQVIDLETSHLRPYSKNAALLSVGFGTWDLSYAIPLEHPEAKWSTKQLDKLYELIEFHLLNKSIRFWAHALKFELEWLHARLGKQILFEPNWHDTMAQAHILNEQREKSLEARSVALLGVDCKALDRLDKNNMAAEPLRAVLKYNARDCKFTDKVREIQCGMIEKEGLQERYRDMVTRVPTLVLAQAHGVLPDTGFAEAKHRELTMQANLTENKIQKLKAVRDYVIQTGQPFNPNSNPQLGALMRDVLRIREGWRVEKGVKKYSVDEEVLNRVDHPLAKLVLELRGLKKLDSTYIKGLCPSEGAKYIYPDGLVHTNYNHLLTSSSRLSSDDPNEQNYPKRKHKEIRNVFIAPSKHKMVAIDYGQIEARIMAIASQCPVLTKALWEHYDIHMDWILKLTAAFRQLLDKYRVPENNTQEKIIRAFRQDFKSEWTFPLFFGSELAPVAERWGLPERKLRPYYEEFWDTYKAVKEWQKVLVAEYRRLGYVETLTGHRRYGPLTLNELTNHPIQGTASDVVVNAMERLSKAAYKLSRWQLQPRMNIHDDLTFYLPERSLEQDLELILPIMCQPTFSFVNVPITVEISIGTKWGELEEIATVESTEYGYPKVENSQQGRRAATASQVSSKDAGRGNRPRLRNQQSAQRAKG